MDISAKSKRCTVETFGKIIKLEEKGNKRYNPTFRYTVDGKTIETMLKKEDYFFQVGKAYYIYYNPNNPEEMVLKKGDDSVSLLIQAFVIGTIGAITGLIVLRAATKKKVDKSLS